MSQLNFSEELPTIRTITDSDCTKFGNDQRKQCPNTYNLRHWDFVQLQGFLVLTAAPSLLALQEREQKEYKVILCFF